MFIAVDKNQFSGSHEQSNRANHDALASMGHTLVPTVLPYGDYAFMTPEMTDIMKRRGKKLRRWDYMGSIPIAIDRKGSVGELAQNLCSGKEEHERFQNEIFLAMKCNTVLYVLVEDNAIRCVDDVETWQNPRIAEYYRNKALVAKGWHFQRPLPTQPPVNGKRLAATLRTVSDRYHVQFVFCTPQEAPAAIVGILSQSL